MEQMKEKVKAFVEEHKVGVAIGATLTGVGVVGKIFYTLGMKHGCLITATVLNDKLPQANIMQTFCDIVRPKNN